MNKRIEEPFRLVILSAAKNLKTQILRCAQDDKLNLDEGRLYSFIVVRVRVVILNEVKNLDPSLTLLDDSSPLAVHKCLLKMFISSMGITE